MYNLKRIIMKNLLYPLAAGILLLTGCSKDPLNDLTTEETRIYITDHDGNVNFRNYATYSVSDSVAVLDGNYQGKQLNNVDRAFIAALNKYMSARGYTQVSKESKPDLGLNITRIINTTTGVVGYNNYWDYYGGYWDPFYWGYGGYGYYSPYWYSTYEIREGLLSFDMLDLKNATSNGNKINLIWTGMIRGSGIFDAATADSQVQALFNQSAYITK